MRWLSWPRKRYKPFDKTEISATNLGTSDVYSKIGVLSFELKLRVCVFSSATSQ